MLAGAEHLLPRNFPVSSDEKIDVYFRCVFPYHSYLVSRLVGIGGGTGAIPGETLPRMS
jgi:hypothetical protein